jgi:hypothetical protein
MALRIEKAFGVRMDTLMRMQASYGIARTRKLEKKIHVRPFVPVMARRRTHSRRRRSFRMHLHHTARASYRGYMSKVDLDFNETVPLTEDEDKETLAAIDRGIQVADQGRSVSLDEAREMIPKWISESASPNKR